jgi:hypothetical protein
MDTSTRHLDRPAAALGVVMTAVSWWVGVTPLTAIAIGGVTLGVATAGVALTRRRAASPEAVDELPLTPSVPLSAREEGWIRRGSGAVSTIEHGVRSLAEGALRDGLTPVAAQARDALEDLRTLAHGIYPPLLADQGLVAALEAQARRSPVPVDVVAPDLGRFAPEIEAAVYFSSLEALQNVAKYAGASRVDVTLEDDGHGLAFTVSDDGVGFDRTSPTRGTGLQGMADRLDAVGGSLEVRSEPGQGTAVVGRVPVR